MLYNLFILLRVLFYQLLELVCSNKLNYIEEMEKTISEFRKINDIAVSRKTRDIGIRANMRKCGERIRRSPSPDEARHSFYRAEDNNGISKQKTATHQYCVIENRAWI